MFGKTISDSSTVSNDWNNIVSFEIWYVTNDNVDIRGKRWNMWCDPLMGKMAQFSHKRDAIRELTHLNRFYNGRYSFKMVKMTRKSIS